MDTARNAHVGNTQAEVVMYESKNDPRLYERYPDLVGKSEIEIRETLKERWTQYLTERVTVSDSLMRMTRSGDMHETFASQEAFEQRLANATAEERINGRRADDLIQIRDSLAEKSGGTPEAAEKAARQIYDDVSVRNMAEVNRGYKFSAEELQNSKAINEMVVARETARFEFAKNTGDMVMAAESSRAMQRAGIFGMTVAVLLLASEVAKAEQAGEHERALAIAKEGGKEFALEALKWGGIQALATLLWPPAGAAVGIYLIGIGVFEAFKALPALANNLADLFSVAQRFVPRRDPLTLDLDGDGLETVPPNATNPILFDHTGDGIRVGTGWVKADDGFLVLDRDGNGTIDSGRELFGDSP